MKNQTIVVAAAVAAGGVLAYLAWRKGGALLSTTFNPASDQNAAYAGTNAVLQGAGIIAPDSTAGSSLFDLFHTEYDPNAPAGTPVEQNIFSAGLDKITGLFKGTPQTPPIVAQPSTAPYDYGTGGTPGIPWAPSSTTPTTDPAPWWAGNPLI